MPSDIDIQLEFYSEQLDFARAQLAKEPGNPDQIKLIADLEATVKNLARADPMESHIFEEVSEQTIEGRTCEVFYDEKWFNAEILVLRIDDKNVHKVIVKLIGTENAREYDLKDIKLLPEMPDGSIKAGSRVQAIWKEDGLWYNGTITGLNPEKECLVEFDGFEGKAEVVKRDQVREPIIVSADVKVKETKTYMTPGGYVIPEKLKIDKSKDSEAVMADKKRKAHHLKSQQRSEKLSEEAHQSKQKWQQFQQKHIKR